MPYEIPTADQFKARFPVFADSDDELINLLLAEAATNVSTRWVKLTTSPRSST